MRLSFVLTKLLRGLITLLIAVTFVFLVLRTSGDPLQMMLPDDTTPEITERYREMYGLDRSLPEQYLLYVGGLRPRHVIGAYEDLGMEIVGTGYEFGHNDDYQRTTHYVKDGTLIYDDVTGYEFEQFVEKIQPDLVGAGIKEKYVFQKMGVPFRQMHSWDYSGPYHGYDGFAIFARDMDMAINNPVWGMTQTP